ncbi:hypothetical protein KLP40_01955 [Hymenobacter sp. NST-14]|uniref:hypothetical protein n=1 Tax=Hymenobacter piscis TaxID=2839984 RepID=UPI001C03553A|nr:hypothetical protein [Hymenobacter piscis]MBT9391914.1 hypothetical protein [Hymenobacter piscis]
MLFPYSATNRPAESPAARRRAYGLLLALLALSLLTALLTRGTFDSGDSIYHYQYARYAFRHPLNFLESWSKPVVVALMAGPAQLGLRGVMVLQCLLVAASAGLAYRAARRLQLPWPWLAIVACYAAPDYFLIQFSGLTEPTFSLLLIAAVALALEDRPVWAAAVASWLPMARSEGFLLLGVFGLYLLVRRQWRALPWLGLGFVCYGLIGLLVYQDFFWVLTRNAYPLYNLNYAYAHHGGKTPWQFIIGLADAIGWVQFGLFWLGIIGLGLGVVRARKQWAAGRLSGELLLVYGNLVVFIGAHTVFWLLGIFGSLGLLRVLCCVVPLLVLVVVRGVALLAALARTEQQRRYVRWALLAAVVWFPFSGSRVGLRWQRDFGQAPDQQVLDAAARWVATQPRPPRIIYSHPYAATALHLDPFALDRQRFAAVPDTVWPLTAGTLIVWDDWFAPVEDKTTFDQLRQNPRLRLRWQQALPRNPRKPAADSTWVAIFEHL